MKKTVFLILLAVILVFTATCKQKENKAIRVFHWGDTIEMGNVRKIIKDIKTTYDIDVVQERAPAGNPYMEKLLTQAAGGMAPDIVFVEVGNIQPMISKGLLVDLTPYLEEEKKVKGGFSIKDYYPEVVDRFTVDGKIYVIPRDIAPICVIYYNKNLFNEAGLDYPKDDWDWDDFLEIAKKLTKKDKNGKITQYAFLDEWTIWEAWVYSNGGSIVDNVKNPSKITLDSKEAIEGVQFRADLCYKYDISPKPSVAALSQGVHGTSTAFMNQQVAMFFTGYWKSGFFRSIRNFEWDVVMFPKGPKGKRAFPSGGSGYAITTQCKRKEEAWKVLKSFAGEGGQKHLSSQGGLQPALISLAKSKQFLDDKPPANKKIMLDAVKHIVFTPLHPDWEEMNIGHIAPGLDGVWSGKMTAEEALTKLTKKLNRDFFNKKRRNE